MPGLLNSFLAPVGAGWAAAMAALTPLWWARLNEPSGSTVTDSATGAHNGTYPPSFTLNVAGATTDGDKAVTAGGSTTDTLIATNAWMDTTTAWSAAVWVKTSTTGTERTAFGRGTNTTTINWSLGVSTTNKALVRNRTSASSGSIIGTTTITDGAWHLIVGTWDGTNFKLYVDGVQENSNTAQGGTQTNATNLRLGGLGGVRTWTAGDGIDEAAFWGVALTSGQVAALFAAK